MAKGPLARVALLSVVVGTVAACAPSKGGDAADTDSPSVRDRTPPALSCAPIVDGQREGQEVAVSCTVTDDSGVFLVYVVFRPSTSVDWNKRTLQQVDEEGTFEGSIPAVDVLPGTMDYYSVAVDGSSNAGALPPDAPDSYYTFTVL